MLEHEQNRPPVVEKMYSTYILYEKEKKNLGKTTKINLDPSYLLFITARFGKVIFFVFLFLCY